MKKVIVTSLISTTIWRNLAIEDPTNWIASCVANNSWGYGERKLIKKGQEGAQDYNEILVVSEVTEEVEPERQQTIYEKDSEGDYVLQEVTVQDQFGNDTLVKQPIPTGETETVPAIMVTYVNLRPEYDIVITDITADYDLNKRINENIALGKKIKALCEDALDLITGSNILTGKTVEEIDQMEIDLNDIAVKLERKRLDSAKILILALNNPIYNTLKDDVLKLYERHGF